MACQTVTFAEGMRAIACDRTKPAKCRCGRRAERLCDWIVDKASGATCDRSLCMGCTFAPAQDKDLCPTHRATYEEWRAIYEEWRARKEAG